MDIDALKSFLAFVETGSFTRAARQINRTQSAFSAQMRKLEEELNVNLFEKEGRNLVLTEAGLALRAHADSLISLHNKTIKSIKRYQDKKPLRLGCPEDYNDAILPYVMMALKQAEPTCSIHIYNQPSYVLRDWLDEGKLDAAIVTRAANTQEGYWLASDQGVWIRSHDFIHNNSAPLPLALFQTDCNYHIAAIEGLSKQGKDFQLLACCNTASAQRAIVREGLAIGAMGRLSTTPDLVIMDDMPPLPAVDIALLLSATQHPLLDKETLEQYIHPHFTAADKV